MEVAAGLLIAEQVISTTIEAGVVAGIAVARPTNKLKANFIRIGTVPSDSSPDSLARSHHSINVIDGDVFIYGGRVSREQIAGQEMHILKLSNIDGLGPDYKAIPALARDGNDIPQARAGHTSCTIENKIVMFGGYCSPQTKEPLDEGGRVWIFDPASLQWSYLDIANERYPKLHSHSAIAYGNTLIIHGGYSLDLTSPCSDTWCFDLSSRVWTELPALNNQPTSLPVVASAPPNLITANGRLYLISGSSSLGGQLHFLDLKSDKPPTAWTRMDFPTNPLTPGPRPRQGAIATPITTALGRTYLLLALGAKVAVSESSNGSIGREDSEASTGVQKDLTSFGQEDFWSELWTLQLPAADYTPSKFKDATRSTIGMSSGEAEWSEVEIVLPEELPVENGAAGKLHPGPRGYFGSAAIDQGRVVIWGGINPRGEIEGDGWIIEVKA